MSYSPVLIFFVLTAFSDTFIRDARSGQAAMQQSVCRVLGVLDYTMHPHGIIPVVNFLLDGVDRSVRDLLWRSTRI